MTPPSRHAVSTQSLTALGVDYVDILFVHGPEPSDTVATDELREFFERARQQGKIRAWGVSQDEGLEVDLCRPFASGGSGSASR